MLTGRKIDLAIKDESLSFLEPYIQEAPDQVATILLVFEMLKFKKQNNEFRVRMWKSYVNHFPELHAESKEKLLKATEHIKVADYTTIDVADYYPREGGVSIAFLPTYVGGYEHLFKALDESLSWPTPSFQLLTQERREMTMQTIVDSGDYIVYTISPASCP